MTPRRRVASFAVVALVVAAAVVCGIALSGVAAARPGAQTVRVRVVQADRYCTSRSGYDLMLCPRLAKGLIHLGGSHNQWLVIFSFTAPRSTPARGQVYYFFTAHAPSGCASAFGEYDQEVRKGQRVVNWSTFDEDCPGRGDGTISLIRSRAKANHWPGEGASRLISRFGFVIP
jgi:hypothetical protein